MAISHLSLFKRSNGFWYILYVDEGKLRWKTTRCTHKNDALRKLTEFQSILNDKRKSKPLSVFSQEFLSFAEANHAKPTGDIFKIALRHLQAVAGDRLLSSLTQEHLDRYKTERLKSIAPTSVNVELRALRAILNIALRWKLVEDNPFAGMKTVRVPDTSPAFLTKDDFSKLLSVVKEEWFKQVIVFSAITGMRRGEVVNLRWDEVDLDRKLLRIQSSPTFKTKAGKQRTIPLNNLAVQVLKSRAGRSHCQYVFNVADERIAESYISHRFKDYVRLAHLNPKLHFHSLRHTFATWLVQNGVSIYEVQKLLGHSSVATTQIYSHLASQELHEAVNRISFTGLN